MFPKAKSLGLLFKDHKMLLEEQEGKHSKGTGLFYRPIGGTIEIGEKSDETVIREYGEELSVEITIQRYVTCRENIFTIDGHIGHELIQIYIVELEDKSLNEQEIFKVVEGDKITCAKWISLEDIIKDKKITYPNGLKEVLCKMIGKEEDNEQLENIKCKLCL
ncbi:NUDIX hydrolase [Psychrobacillus lasiicapitis]|uniref:NUDIX domain-containing protein n=1 Tax=Psychrobacillus lasiicapitis TaxID=1636719 RepID=A0A544SWN5_9BACI|nr:NUDIX domain-containing protein [Psychrobacillus lasiicapitis]TQR09613.1 NUDIX domain-containing protein [Psychrobacillus lasiicapitis]GGA29015.1 DNA mismatch repair protein MutT [Psychrobacillus lasiicapitis]